MSPRKKSVREPSEVIGFLEKGLVPIGSSTGVRSTQKIRKRFPDETVEPFAPRANAVRVITVAFVENREKAEELLKIIRNKRLTPSSVLNLIRRKTKSNTWVKSLNYKPPERG